MTLKIFKLKKNEINKKISREIYNFLIMNIKNSVFRIFGYNYFLEFLKINHKNVYLIKKNNKIVSYISYINQKNELRMKKLLILNLKRDFIKNFYLILFNIKFLFKIHSSPNNFIQLMHLIINLKGNENYTTKLLIHHKINNLHKKVVGSKYSGVYAMFENSNLIASKYYKKNFFRVFKNNFYYTFVKKDF